MTEAKSNRACRLECEALRADFDAQTEMLREAGEVCERLTAELDALKSQAPIAYMYEYTWPMDGSPVWRRDSQEWYGQQAKSSRPIYAKPMPSIPDGYQLVPIEPKYSMVTAGMDVGVRPESPVRVLYLSMEEVTELYRAMLAAAKEES